VCSVRYFVEIQELPNKLGMFKAVVSLILGQGVHH